MDQHPSELSALPSALLAHVARPAHPTHLSKPTPPLDSAGGHGRSVLAWPAWRRVAVVAPALGLLWLAVWWAMVEVAPL